MANADAIARVANRASNGTDIISAYRSVPEANANNSTRLGNLSVDIN